MPQQRRGLGKGLGALIPTSPAAAPTAGRPPPGRKAARGPDSRSLRAVMDRGTDVAAGPSPADVAGAYFDEIPVGAIVPNPRQPRDIFDDDALAELADSIRLVGLLQPIVVRPVAPGRYEIVMGERRWRACQLAELELIPSIVRETSDTDLLRDALHREPAPRAAQRAGGSRGLPAAPR